MTWEKLPPIDRQFIVAAINRVLIQNGELSCAGILQSIARTLGRRSPSWLTGVVVYDALEALAVAGRVRRRDVNTVEIWSRTERCQ